MRIDGEKRVVRPEVPVWICGVGAGWSAGTRDTAIPDTLLSVAKPVALDGMTGSRLIGGERKYGTETKVWEFLMHCR